MEITLDPADKLLIGKDPASIHKTENMVLKDLDKIWNGEAESIEQLRRCLEPGSR